MNASKPTYISVGINFATWAVATRLEFNYAKGTYAYHLEGPNYRADIERYFDPNDTKELRYFFGDELIDKMLVMWREYRALPIDEDMLW